MTKTKIGIFGMVPISFLKTEPSRNEIIVYTAIASFQGSNLECFPTLAQIAERAGFREPNHKTAINKVSTAISNLLASGWVERRRRRNSSSIYSILVDVALDSQQGRETGTLDSQQGRETLFPCTSGTKRTIKEQGKLKKHLSKIPFRKISDSFISLDVSLGRTKPIYHGIKESNAIKRLWKLYPDADQIIALGAVLRDKIKSNPNDRFWVDYRVLPSGLTPAILNKLNGAVRKVTSLYEQKGFATREAYLESLKGQTNGL